LKKAEREQAKKFLELASKMDKQEKDVFISFEQGMVLMKERFALMNEGVGNGESAKSQG
jgi:hypothetical protein